MWYFRKPNRSEIQGFLAAQHNGDFSYPAVGAIQGPTPHGFFAIQNRVLLGTGPETFATACEAIRRWQMFPHLWTELLPPNTPLQPGNDVVVLARCYGLWWLNACRIVNLIEPSKRNRRFGFVYGTLSGHMECGEELFMVEQDEQNQVWYEVASFSRPGHWLTQLGQPLARRQQLRFVRDSGRAMQQAVLSPAGPRKPTKH